MEFDRTVDGLAVVNSLNIGAPRGGDQVATFTSTDDKLVQGFWGY